MIVTDDARLADLCRSLRNQGRAISPGTGSGMGEVGSWLRHERLGYNYRLSELSAALGVAQMRRLDELIEKRAQVANRYMQRLMGTDQIVLPTVDEQTAMSWFVFVVRLAAGYTREERDSIIRGLRNHEVGAADYFPCIHLQPFYREKHGFREGMFPIAESVSSRTIALPFHTKLSVREVDLVAQTLEVLLQREGLSRA